MLTKKIKPKHQRKIRENNFKNDAIKARLTYLIRADHEIEDRNRVLRYLDKANFQGKSQENLLYHLERYLIPSYPFGYPYGSTFEWIRIISMFDRKNKPKDQSKIRENNFKNDLIKARLAQMICAADYETEDKEKILRYLDKANFVGKGQERLLYHLERFLIPSYPYGYPYGSTFEWIRIISIFNRENNPKDQRKIRENSFKSDLREARPVQRTCADYEIKYQKKLLKHLNKVNLKGKGKKYVLNHLKRYLIDGYSARSTAKWLKVMDIVDGSILRGLSCSRNKFYLRFFNLVKHFGDAVKKSNWFFQSLAGSFSNKHMFILDYKNDNGVSIMKQVEENNAHRFRLGLKTISHKNLLFSKLNNLLKLR
jgi:hypothetical protein